MSDPLESLDWVQIFERTRRAAKLKSMPSVNLVALFEGRAGMELRHRWMEWLATNDQRIFGKGLVSPVVVQVGNESAAPRQDRVVAEWTGRSPYNVVGQKAGLLDYYTVLIRGQWFAIRRSIFLDRTQQEWTRTACRNEAGAWRLCHHWFIEDFLSFPLAGPSISCMPAIPVDCDPLRPEHLSLQEQAANGLTAMCRPHVCALAKAYSEAPSEEDRLALREDLPYAHDLDNLHWGKKVTTRFPARLRDARAKAVRHAARNRDGFRRAEQYLLKLLIVNGYLDCGYCFLSDAEIAFVLTRVMGEPYSREQVAEHRRELGLPCLRNSRHPLPLPPPDGGLHPRFESSFAVLDWSAGEAPALRLPLPRGTRLPDAFASA